MDGQASVYFSVSSRHWRVNVPAWSYVISGARQHGNHWANDDVSQVSLLVIKDDGRICRQLLVFCHEYIQEVLVG